MDFLETIAACVLVVFIYRQFIELMKVFKGKVIFTMAQGHLYMNI